MMEWWNTGMMEHGEIEEVAEYTKRWNVNRGYMRLEVWQKAMTLARDVSGVLSHSIVDLRLRSQVLDAVHSVAANIAEGYSRRSLNEYMQYLYVSLGSLSETLTRLLALREAGVITPSEFEQIDSLHYEIENKMWALIKSLEQKRKAGDWIDRVTEPEYELNSPEGRGKPTTP